LLPGLDLTILLGLVVVVAAAADVVRTRSLPAALWVAIGAALIMVPGVVGASTEYGVDKARAFFTLTLLAILAATIVLRERRQREAFLRTLAGLGIAVAFLVTVAPASTSELSSVVTLSGTNTISTSQMILAGAIVVVMDAITKPRPPAPRILLGLLGAIMIFTALNTGSRGPVVSVGISIILALLLAPAFKRRRGRSIFAVAALAAVALFVATRTAGEGLTRVVSFLSGDQDTSTMARSYFWETAWAYSQKMPTGGGWGFFGTVPEVFLSVAEGGQLYPHNLVLEITLEAGWLSGALFVVLAIASAVRLIFRAHDGVTLTLFVLLVFTFINAMVSGDINDNRLMWTLLMIAWVIPKPSAGDDEATSSGRVDSKLKHRRASLATT
ncbi:O-antigen ligase family protein, partial [Microbacterium sp. ISL-103]|uniref:O-antigen ligase family protein n=1 Tax=Microbacterium sp. ISL-103 TaxID=2819156 RepID=UPI001BE9AD85